MKSPRKNSDGFNKDTFREDLRSVSGKSLEISKKLKDALLQRYQSDKSITISLSLIAVVIISLYITLCVVINSINVCKIYTNPKDQDNFNTFKNSLQVLLTFIPLLLASYCVPNSAEINVLKLILIIIVAISTVSSFVYLVQIPANNSVSGLLISLIVFLFLFVVVGYFRRIQAVTTSVKFPTTIAD